MSISVATALAITAPAASVAFATAAGAQQFASDTYYAGPRVWIGGLSGATAIGGQVEKGLTTAGAYGPGIIAAGLGVDYYSWSYSYGFGSYKYSVIPVQLFGNYHFVVESMKNLDPYGGFAMVYSAVSASWSGTGAAASANGSSLGFAAQGGVRYFLSDKFAVNGQLGFGYGTLGLGAIWRF